MEYLFIDYISRPRLRFVYVNCFIYDCIILLKIYYCEFAFQRKQIFQNVVDFNVDFKVLVVNCDMW